MEQIFNMSTFRTWDSRRGGKLRVVRFRLSMLRMTPIAQKTYHHHHHHHCVGIRYNIQEVMSTFTGARVALFQTACLLKIV
jgi:hypothetical protein